MKNIKLKIMSLMLVVVVALTGCMNVDETIIINSDGSANVTVVMDVDKEAAVEGYIEMMKESDGLTIPKAQAEKVVDETFTGQGEAKIVQIDGKDYYRFKQSRKMTNKEINESFNEEATEAYITADTFYIAEDIKKYVEAQGGGVIITDPSEAEKYFKDTKVVYNVEFTAPVVNCSEGGVVSESNPNRVTFSFDYATATSTSVLFATTKAGVTPATVKATIKKLNTVNTSKIKKLKAAKVTKKAKKAKLNYTLKAAKNVKGYEIQYSLKKNMSKAKILKTKKTKGVIKNLKMGKKYYVRVRCYKTNYANQTIKSKWSAKVSRKTKTNKKKK